MMTCLAYQKDKKKIEENIKKDIRDIFRMPEEIDDTAIKE